MDFELSQDQQLLEENIDQFLRKEWTRADLRAAVADAADSFSDKLWESVGSLGLLGLMVPENFGGAGLGLLEATLVLEQAGFAALPIPLSGHLLATTALVEHGSSQQREAWLPRLSDGSCIGTIGFADRRENGSLDDGVCCSWVEFADRADLLIVCSDDAGIGLVDLSRRKPQLTRHNGADLTRRFWQVDLRSSEITEIDEFGGEATSRILDAARVLLAADAWGASRCLFEAALAHALNREQFGRKIGEFQSVKHPLADMAVVHGFSRALLWDAASAWDIRANEGHEAALLCKAHLTEQAVGHSRQCTELMGATGFAWEEDHHIWLKRTLFDSILLGSPMELRHELSDARGWNAADSSSDTPAEIAADERTQRVESVNG